MEVIDVDFTFDAYKKIKNNNPYEECDVLTCECTNYSVLLLSKTGTLCSWGDNRSCLGRKVIDSNLDCYIPMVIKLNEKIIDISCGFNHVLALSSNGDIFSWGNNQYGQLGLIDFQIDINSDRDEPVRISFFNNVSIKNIYAKGSSSFCITEKSNKLYGWGDNRNCQLGQNCQYLSFTGTPTLVIFSKTKLNDFCIVQSRLGNESYLLLLNNPSNIIGESIMYFENRIVTFKEKYLKEIKQIYKKKVKIIKERKPFKEIKGNSKYSNKLISKIRTLAEFYNLQMNSLKENLKLIDEENNVNKSFKNPKKNKAVDLESYLEDIFKNAESNIVSNKKLDLKSMKDKESIEFANKDELKNCYDVINVCNDTASIAETILLKNEKYEVSTFPDFLKLIDDKIVNLTNIKIRKDKSLISSIGTMIEEIGNTYKLSKDFLPLDKYQPDYGKNVDFEFIDKTKEMYSGLLKLKQQNINMHKTINFFNEKIYSCKLKSLMNS